ncbi:hypothetical protein NT6N_04570 [Oceaniferula spumae]|uniref:IrrE N-terminal-like domain-containing protein n=1 Tax=Oceaniferula spumae TaxID=2979115 RepID=A0AAT9FHF8_9BACT
MRLGTKSKSAAAALSLLLGSSLVVGACDHEERLRVRVEATGFNASASDISKVLEYAGRPLWRNFKNYRVEPIMVIRGDNGPITLYKRNLKGEIIVMLDTNSTLWAQYSYQWAHELCHVLCGFRNDGHDNKWFEETICELASLYCMRAASKDWAANPPYPHWKSYAPHLKAYADKTMGKYEQIKAEDLDVFYQKHRDELRKSSTLRHHNGAMAAALLPLFEKNPNNWEALRYLNATPAKKGLSFKDFLAKWHNDAPEKHRKFITHIAQLYGVK